jgi:hypothetical protein
VGVGVGVWRTDQSWSTSPIRAGAISSAVVCAVLVAACSSSGRVPAGPSTTGLVSSPAPGPSATASPSPISPVDLAKRQAITAYLGMWADMVKAATTSDWRSTTLTRHAAGAALQVISGSLYADHLNGVVTKGSPTNNPRVSSAGPPTSPATVLISDCGDDSRWLKYRTDGHLLDNTPGGRRSITAEVMKQSDGVWRVTSFAVEAVGTC